MKPHQVIRSHDPYEPHPGASDFQFDQGIGRELGSEPRFQVGRPHSAIPRDPPCRRQTIRQRRHVIVTLQWVLRAHQPPDLIQIKAVKGQPCYKQMALMRRVERPAHQAHGNSSSIGPVAGKCGGRAGSDARAALDHQLTGRGDAVCSHGRVWPVPRTTYLKLVSC